MDIKFKIIDSLRRNGFEKVSRVPLEKQAYEFLSEQRVQEQIGQICGFVPDLHKKKLLEIGSGYGTFVAFCNKNHICEAHGIEPGQDAYADAYGISREVLARYGVSEKMIRNAGGESIPHPDSTFDLIWSTNVLEHVTDPAKVLAEAYRVLKPGGTAVFVVPNYGSFWEGHYGVLFPAHCPKWLFKAIVKLIGRDPAFVDTLQFVTYGKLKKWMSPFASEIEVITTGQEIWEERVRTLQFSEWAELAKLKSIIKLIHALRLLNLVVWLGKKLHWETPFVLVFRKRS